VTTYEHTYTGDAPTVFVDIQIAVNGPTWEPSKGDKVVLDHVVAHPLLRVRKIEAPKAKKAAKVAKTEKAEPIPATVTEQTEEPGEQTDPAADTVVSDENPKE